MRRRAKPQPEISEKLKNLSDRQLRTLSIVYHLEVLFSETASAAEEEESAEGIRSIVCHMAQDDTIRAPRDCGSVKMWKRYRRHSGDVQTHLQKMSDHRLAVVAWRLVRLRGDLADLDAAHESDEQ